MHGAANSRVDVVSEISIAVSSNTSFNMYSISKECIDYTEAVVLFSLVPSIMAEFYIFNITISFGPSMPSIGLFLNSNSNLATYPSLIALSHV